MVAMDATQTRETTGDLFAARRARFMRQLGPDTAAVFLSNPQQTRSNDTQFDYRPNSDLWYLTGYEEPESAAVLLPEHPDHPFVMFVRPRDHKTEVWDGPRTGVEGVCEAVGADASFEIKELGEQLPKLLEGRERVVYGLGYDEDADNTLIQAYRQAVRKARGRKKAPKSIVDPQGLLHEMRLIKSPEEIEALRRSCRLSAEAHRRAMACTRPGMTEYELQAEIEYVFKRGGARSPGYPSIVGSGPNACVLHYVDNRRRMEEGDLVLVDAGAEVDFYTADITRTWPVSGHYNGYQREVYDLVLRAQMDAIRLVKPGLPYQKIHEATVRAIAEGLVDLGILDGNAEEAIKEKTYRKYFMHGTGHWLGIDVHDVGLYARDGEPGRPLEPGMVFTIEPGIYFHPDESECPADYRGIGVRIEDDILVTEDGYEVLSQDAPKEPEEIEDLVGSEA